MKIASWNINSLRKREERLLLWLREMSPDIVCLQETKCTDEQFPVASLRDAGYAAVFHGQKSYNGVAILAREEPRDVRSGFCDEVEDDQARMIAGNVGDVRVISIYAPNGQAIGQSSLPIQNGMVSSPDQLPEGEGRRPSAGPGLWRFQCRA